MTDPTAPPVLSPLLEKLQRRICEPGLWVYSADLDLLKQVHTAWCSDVVDLDAQRATVARLQARLERVREWAEAADHYPRHLREILDGSLDAEKP